MLVEPSARVIERIDHARRSHPGGVLATDGDGTLWSGDVGEDLWHAFLAHGDVRPEAHRAMVSEAEEHGVASHGAPVVLAERLYAEYLAGRFPEERVCELMTWCFAGWTKSEVDAFADRVVASNGLAARLHREVGAVLAWAKGAGVETWLVSASPIAIIERAALVAGIAPTHIVAAIPEYETGRMVTRCVRPIPYGPGKVTNLLAHLERSGAPRPLYAAFGDNAFDVAMLSHAFIPVAVRPKPRLRERAHEVPSLVEIAPEH